MIECNSFEKCSAPICPLDHPENAIWYPSEDTCTKRPIPKWVKKQRRIAKKTKKPGDYLTLKILTSTSRTGINPDGIRKQPEFEDLRPKSVCSGDLSPNPLPVTIARKKLNDGLRRYNEQKRRKNG